MDIILGVLVTCGVVYGMVVWLTKANKTLSTRSFASILEKMEGFVPSQTYLVKKCDAGIAVDEHSGKLALIYGVSNVENPVAELVEQETIVYNFGELLETQVLENGDIKNPIKPGDDRVTEKDQKIKTLELRILADNGTKADHLMVFMSVDRPVEKNSPIYQEALEKALHWQKLINNAISKTVRDQPAVVVPKDTPTDSIAGELLKLAELLEKGYITREEFEGQKAKILGN